MIFVTVGTARGFSRLVTKMDEIAGKIDEEVIIQLGTTNYKPAHAKYFTLKSRDGILESMKKARVIVSHGGSSSVSDILELGHPAIIVPRLKKYNEVINDHQVELCQALEKQGRIVAVYDIEKLEEALGDSKITKPIVKKNHRLIDALKKYIDAFEVNAKQNGLPPENRTTLNARLL